MPKRLNLFWNFKQDYPHAKWEFVRLLKDSCTISEWNNKPESAIELGIETKKNKSLK